MVHTCVLDLCTLAVSFVKVGYLSLGFGVGGSITDDVLYSVGVDWLGDGESAAREEEGSEEGFDGKHCERTG